MRGGYFTFKTDYIKPFPVPAKIPPEVSSNIEALVSRILTLKKSNPSADTSALEAEIDELVYDLYGLTEEEKAIVRASGAQKSEVRGQRSGGGEEEELEPAVSGQKSGGSKPMAAPKKRGRKPQLPPSLPGWD